jgi:hypothetical protein
MPEIAGLPLPEPGDRVEAVDFGPSMIIDDNETVPPGTRGTVVRCNEKVGQIWMDWDNGATIALLVREDTWKAVT